MAKFLLRPCKVRGGHIVDSKDEAVEMDWDALCKKLAPSKDRQALMNLRTLQIGAFVGLSTNTRLRRVGNFVLLNQDRSGNLRWILKKDPEFERRVLEVYRVEDVRWDSKVVESSP